MLDKNVKSDIIKKFARSENDTGSSEVQIAIISNRISQIAIHLKSFPKDTHSRRGLIALVSKRKKLVSYLKKNNDQAYTSIVNLLKRK